MSPNSIKNSSNGTGMNPWASGTVGEISINAESGQVMMHTGSGAAWTTLAQPTVEELLEREIKQKEMTAKFIREQEIEKATHKERLEAIKTFFPRGHQFINNLDVMIDIAREDQLNPMYEQILKEFDEAKLAMSRAANKLASAVKLTDSEEIEKRTRIDTDMLGSAMNYNSAKAGIGYVGNLSGKSQTTFAAGTMSGNHTIATTGPMGPMGAPGMTGPQGPQGPKGDKGDSRQSWIEHIKFMVGLK